MIIQTFYILTKKTLTMNTASYQIITNDVDVTVNFTDSYDINCNTTVNKNKDNVSQLVCENIWGWSGLGGGR